MDTYCRVGKGMFWGVGVTRDRLMGKKEDRCNTLNNKENKQKTHYVLSLKILRYIFNPAMSLLNLNHQTL